MFSLTYTGFALALLAGMLLDLLLGEVRRWHPLVGFGWVAQRIERYANHPEVSRFEGAMAWVLAVLPLVLFFAAILFFITRLHPWLGVAMHALLLYFCLGLRSLRDHNLPIQQALENQDLPLARQLTSYIVSRDTADADADYLAKASAESVLENGCDAVFGTLFWFAIGGGAGAVLYRLSNTLDAMWGYRTPRYLRFGCVAARIDDVLNFVPARLTAITYALLGKTRLALTCWRQQAPAWSSPNAGPVMAAGAGALGIALGGSARYDGIDEVRPVLGQGKIAVAADIGRAWQLVFRGSWLWAGALLTYSLLAGGI